MRPLRVCLILTLCVPILLVAAPIAADPPTPKDRPSLIDGERPSPHYPSILYADIAPALAEMARTSRRLRVEQIGYSAGDLPLYLATVSSPENLAHLSDLVARRRAMIEGEAGTAVRGDICPDLPVIVMVNAGLQGNVYAGVDAALATIRWLAHEDAEEVRSILENVVLLVNVVPNPDGRVTGSPGNANDLEPPRDLVAQSQPETQAIVGLLATWSPMVVLDVDGLGATAVIGASPPPRQVPSGDLYLAWSLDIAHAMSAAVHDASGYAPETVTLGPETAIGDWPPLDLATYASYHGAYGFGLTIASRDGSGVSFLQAAIRGALEFVSVHHAALVRDQARLLDQGLLRGAPPSRPNPYLAAGSYAPSTTSATGGDPAAYLIPACGERQLDRHEAAALANLLIANGVRVERTLDEIMVRWESCPSGAYLVRLDQPLGSLAAELLWAPGQTGSASGHRSLSGWSLPLAWGVTCLPLERVPDVATERVAEARPPRGNARPGPAAGYAYGATSNAAIAATNALLREAVRVHWAPTAFSTGESSHPAGTFVLPADQDGVAGAVALLTDEHRVDIEPLPTLPSGLTPLRPLRVAAHANPSVLFVLRGLGFDVTRVTAEELSAGQDLGAYDVLIVSGQAPLWERLSFTGKRMLRAYARDGGHIVAIGAAGADLTVAAGLADIDPTITSRYTGGMAAITCDGDDPLTASYSEHTVLYAQAPVWFTYLPDDTSPVAHLSPAGPLLTGYWPVWDDINPSGQPFIVHIPQPRGSLTLLGIDPTYGAYGRHGYRLLAQAIYRTLAVRRAESG